jgi:hypothetical protein
MFSFCDCCLGVFVAVSWEVKFRNNADFFFLLLLFGMVDEAGLNDPVNNNSAARSTLYPHCCKQAVRSASEYDDTEDGSNEKAATPGLGSSA